MNRGWGFVRRMALLVIIVFVIALFSGCSNVSTSRITTNSVNVLKTSEGILVKGTTEGVKDFIQLQGAYKREYEDDSCYNITPLDIMKTSKFKIFKYNKSCASFLMYDGKIYSLGFSFGGYGVIDMKLADVNGDDMQELYFTFSWGSGLHRSQVGCFDSATKDIRVFDFSHMNNDMIIKVSDMHNLYLYSADVSTMDDFVNYEAKPIEKIAEIIFKNNQIILNPIYKKN